ncbi:MAG: prolyl oligopeptidase family serine peptidase [Alphaproteobacteria bacterium]|nr:prolyl oligopeptidase family serine peptidase [Alphaproteobacteria bacterium]
MYKIKLINILFVVNFLLWSSFSATASSLFPEIVGVKTVFYYDSARLRPLVGNIYYPVDKNIQGEDKADPMVHAKEAKNAPVKRSKEPYPLIIISHGYGGSREHLSWLAEALTNAGYIVATIDHFGNTASFDTPKIALQRWLRPQDISAFLDNFLKDPEFSSLIETNHIGFAGYSLGGLTGIWLAGGIADQFTKPIVGKSSIYELARDATEQDVDSIDYDQALKSYMDARIKAEFLMAPAHGQSFSTKGLKNIHIPILIVVGENDKVTPPSQHADHYAKSIPGVKLDLLKGNVSHYVFRNQIRPDKINCVSSFEFEVDPSVDIKALHEETAGLAIDFFNKHLKK